MESLDQSLTEVIREIGTSVSEFSVSLDEDDSCGLVSLKPQESEIDSAELTTDYAKVPYTLGEVIVYQININS